MSDTQQVHVGTTTHETRDAMLLAFLRDFDAPCPNCGYNLHALTKPLCPECNQPLMLTVGVARLQLLWLLVSLAPCFFSGIAACFVLIPIVGRVILGDGRLSIALTATDIFGFMSGATAIALAFRWRTRFLALPRKNQITIALLIWLVHVMALATLIALGPLYM